MITKTKAYKKGICPICTLEYTKGKICYKDPSKPDDRRYVHAACWETMLWNRIKETDPAPF